VGCLLSREELMSSRRRGIGRQKPTTRGAVSHFSRISGEHLSARRQYPRAPLTELVVPPDHRYSADELPVRERAQSIARDPAETM